MLQGLEKEEEPAGVGGQGFGCQCLLPVAASAPESQNVKPAPYLRLNAIFRGQYYFLGRHAGFGRRSRPMKEVKPTFNLFLVPCRLRDLMVVKWGDTISVYLTP
ncbi:MAG: hypothetical protein C0613_13215 [Desulfobulbaceae bacterium]|nr:MAG: hypothetical protein C0613_13215 [Desulfobulbaceae bacterium]